MEKGRELVSHVLISSSIMVGVPCYQRKLYSAYVIIRSSSFYLYRLHNTLQLDNAKMK